MLDEGLERIAKVTELKKFEIDMNEFVGQFKITVNGLVEEFVDKEIPYQGEFLTEWIFLLNEVVRLISKNGFASMSDPGSNNIRYEFNLEKDGFHIKNKSARKRSNKPYKCRIC